MAISQLKIRKFPLVVAMNVQPVLPLTFVLFVARKVAPPVAVLSRIEQISTVIVPEAMEIVHGDPLELDRTVTGLPAVPFQVSDVAVVVVPAVNRTAPPAVLVILMSLKVLLPWIVVVPVDPVATHRL